MSSRLTPTTATADRFKFGNIEDQDYLAMAQDRSPCDTGDVAHEGAHGFDDHFLLVEQLIDHDSRGAIRLTHDHDKDAIVPATWALLIVPLVEEVRYAAFLRAQLHRFIEVNQRQHGFSQPVHLDLTDPLDVFR